MAVLLQTSQAACCCGPDTLLESPSPGVAIANPGLSIVSAEVSVALLSLFFPEPHGQRQRSTATKQFTHEVRTARRGIEGSRNRVQPVLRLPSQNDPMLMKSDISDVIHSVNISTLYRDSQLQLPPLSFLRPLSKLLKQSAVPYTVLEPDPYTVLEPDQLKLLLEGHASGGSFCRKSSYTASSIGETS